MLADRTAFSWEVDTKDKTDEALALAEQMIEWFAANFENPVENTPYDGGEYVFICGGPFDAREQIEANFPAEKYTVHLNAEEYEEVLTAAVDFIEADGTVDWAKIRRDEGELLLYAHPHEWGRGHIHLFNDHTRKTSCGRTLETCPGTVGMGDPGEVNCKVCLSAIERRARA